MSRLITLLVAGTALMASACAGSTSSATGGDEQPLPTIGLGSDLDGEITGGASVRAVGSVEIDTLVMIGDSITVASEPALEEAFARLGFDNVLIQAQESKRAASGSQSNPSGAVVAENLVRLIESVDPDDGEGDDGDEGGGDEDPLDHSNELWVVALGTNDIDQYSDPAERAAAINEVLNEVPDESLLVWVDTYFRDRPEATAELNATIVDRVEQRGNSIIAEWSAVADDDGNLRTDGVHPSDEGTLAFADTVAAAIIDFLQLG